MNLEQLKGAMGAAKKKADADGATDADKQAYEAAKKAYEDGKAAANANQAEVEQLKSQIASLTEERDKHKADLDTASARITELTGSFDDERKKFEAEREAFNTERQGHTATIKSALDLELSGLSETAQAAITGHSEDVQAQWSQLQFLKKGGFLQAQTQAPARTSQSTAGGGVGGNTAPTTLAEIQAKEARGEYQS